MIKIIFIFIIILYFIISINNYFVDGFENLKNIKYYVISLGTPERKNNIKEQNSGQNVSLIFVDAVHWKTINQKQLLDNNVISHSFFKDNDTRRDKEIACYHSHFKTYNEIKTHNPNGYSVILEDDFNMISKDLSGDVNRIIEIMKNTDFDVIFLGNTFYNIGEKYKNNVHKIDKSYETMGCFGYLIKNKNIQKIINSVSYIDEPIDSKFNSLIKTDNLNIYTVNPSVVNYKKELPSLII
jgi:GR25 family glycosyltransferase involved in LPS biosynthesis